MVPQPRIRLAVRVLLLDEDDRLLLFRAVNPTTGVAFWFPPGGEIEPGETLEQTALRELREETGHDTFELGPEIWHRRHVFPWRDETIDQRERWFVARCERFELDASGWTDTEREDLTEHRWWNLADLRSATEHLVPRTLACDIKALLRDGPPDVPTEVGI